MLKYYDNYKLEIITSQKNIAHKPLVENGSSEIWNIREIDRIEEA